MGTYLATIGDTVSIIAFKHGIRPIDILLLNPSIRFEQDYIYPGMRVQIPEHASLQLTISEEDDLLCEYGHAQLENDRIRLEKLGLKSTIIGHSVMASQFMHGVLGLANGHAFTLEVGMQMNGIRQNS